jgi:hypothetical protein
MYSKSRSNCPGETLLLNALNADSQGNFELAYEFYERGITYYLQVKIVNEVNTSIQALIRQTCHEHLRRAEILKSYLETRNTAKISLTNAHKAYKRLDYSTSYTHYMKGIEKLLESAQLIKPSHLQLSNAILCEVATHMTRAEEVDKCLRPTTPPQTAVLLPPDITSHFVTADIADELKTSKSEDNERNESVLKSEETCRDSIFDNNLQSCQAVGKQTDATTSTTVIEPEEHRMDCCSSKRYSTKEEIEVRTLLLRQRIDALVTESNLLLDYLNLDPDNEDKKTEMKQVIANITTILEEADASGECIIGEHSPDREALEMSLLTCQDFFMLPRPLSIFEKNNNYNESRDSNKEENSGQFECLVCCDKVAVMATVPCGHKFLCQECVINIGDELKTCYVCKTELQEPKCIRIFD